MLVGGSIVIFVLSALAPAASSAAPAVACGTSWTTVPSSSAVTDPRGIAAIASNDIWIVGSQLTGTASKVHTAAEHWDGSAWTLATTQNSGLGENNLNGVSAVGSNDVWTVGYWQPQKKTDAAFHTLTEHWNGTSWTIVASPTLGTNSNTLTGVSARSTRNVWAVGYYFNNHVRSTLIEHYDGTSWSVVPSVDPGSQSNSLLAVSTIPADGVVAVGFASDGNGYNPLIERWDGAAWTTDTPAANPGASEQVLAGVASSSASDIWAFGYQVVGSKYKSLTEHFDGSSWTVVPGAQGQDNVVTVLRGGAVRPSDAWGVGFDYHLTGQRYKSFTEHWDGSAWTAVPAAVAQTRDKSEMYAAAFTPSGTQVWASGRKADVETICPAPLGALRTSTSATAHSVGGATRANAAPGWVPAGVPGAIPGVVQPRTAPAHPTQTQTVVAQDVAGAAGLALTTLSHGAVVADFNNDGLPDIFLSRDENPANLYLNNGDGTFTQVDQQNFPHRDRHGCDAADVNVDGRLDIFCATGSDRGTEAKRDELWIQQSDGTFNDLAPKFGILQPFDRGRNSGFMDANGDGYPDVFTTNFPDRADGMPSSNRLFTNQGGTSYALASQYGLEQEINGSGVSVGDYNGDGWQDLLVATTDGIKLYRNDAGTGLTNVSNAVGLNHNAGQVQFADMNGDGKLDVVEINPTNLKVDLQSGGTFSPAATETLAAGQTFATGDANGDGALDIYVANGKTDTQANAPDLVLLNDGTGTNFTQMSVPSTTQGAAEAVTAIDYDGNGLTDFLVENGNGGKPGPVQLIAFLPA
jgi:hypothetical protein